MGLLGDEREPDSIGAPRRRLKLCFVDAAAFRAEFEHNLANGGLFVPTDEEFEPRELVEIELALEFCGERFSLPGEIVSAVPRGFGPGGAGGVAAQVLEAASTLRQRLSRFAALAGPAVADTRPPSPERRQARRAPSRVPARVSSDSGENSAARTRDLSAQGALLSLEGEPPAIGDRVAVTLVHPTHGEALELDAHVVRYATDAEGRPALAVEFEPAGSDRTHVAGFVEDVQAADHARRLGAISGPIDELGVAALLQMFGSSAQRGTLYLARGVDEAVVGFEAGQLKCTRLGTVTGLKALVRLFTWREGRFEFSGSLEAGLTEDAPISLQGALLEAARLQDEEARSPFRDLPPATLFRVVLERLAAEAVELTKAEQAVAELIQAGFALGRLIDVIPDPDGDIYAALGSLVERGIVELR